MSDAFWLDDRAHGAHPGGRYAELVADNIRAFDGTWGDSAAVGFACAAWRIASPPLADPGYVRWHRRVLSATCVRNSWDSSIMVRVSLAAPLPGELTVARDWTRDRGWQGWPELFGRFVDPAREDIARFPHLRTTLRVDAPLPLDNLPPAPHGPDTTVVDVARRALTVVVSEMNQLLNPILERLGD